MTATFAADLPAQPTPPPSGRKRPVRYALVAGLIFGLIAAAATAFVTFGLRHSQQDGRELVTATLLAYPEPIGDGRNAVVLASYTTADAVPHQSRVLVDILANYGDTAQVWVDHGGVAAERPLRLRHIALLTGIAGFGIGAFATGSILIDTPGTEHRLRRRKPRH